MVQYATLRDYPFAGDVDDMRGSLLYGEGGKKIARIKDIVFDHRTGEIPYLVADCGHDRSVLVPLEEVCYSQEKHAFLSDMTSVDLVQLPAFTERLLESDEQWRDYEQLYRAVLEEQHPSRSRGTQSNRRTRDANCNAFAQRVRRNLRQLRRENPNNQDSKRRIA